MSNNESQPAVHVPAVEERALAHAPASITVRNACCAIVGRLRLLFVQTLTHHDLEHPSVRFLQMRMLEKGDHDGLAGRVVTLLTD